jgi:hypothetical protein
VGAVSTSRQRRYTLTVKLDYRTPEVEPSTVRRWRISIDLDLIFLGIVIVIGILLGILQVLDAFGVNWGPGN